MLHEVTADGGIGFCHPALPELLPYGYHGPLVVALDSNLLIDLQQYGHELLNDAISVTEEKYAEELQGLGTLLNVWMLRDIRFVVTPRARTDAKRSTPRFSALIDGLAESLAFQYGDWTVEAPSSWPNIVPIGDELGLPDSADRDLVLQAQAVGAHIFLTSDRRVLRRTALTGPVLRVLAPSAIADELVIAGWHQPVRRRYLLGAQLPLPGSGHSSSRYRQVGRLVLSLRGGRLRMNATPADEATSSRMSRQRRRDTGAELSLRRILHSRGLRYSVDATLPGLSRRRADLTFATSRVVVFVDGCFWHGCPEHKTAPKRNAGWWATKLARNVERDRETDAHLADLGWHVLRIWEHEDPECAADRVEAAVRSVQPRS